jgi:hypothetical protein
MSQESIAPEALYLQLGQLIAEMPDLETGQVSPETNRWLGRAVALVEVSGDALGAATISLSAQQLGDRVLPLKAQKIAAIVYSALARMELKAPAGLQGAFIPAGGTFDAFAAVGKVLGAARNDLFIVDPYADEKFLTDFAHTAAEGVILRVLTDAATHKPSLKPAVERWKKQYPSRPLEVRLAPARTLHDRLIMVDSATVWTVGQSFKDLAERAHSSINRVDAGTAGLKISAYGDLWNVATPL